MKKRNTFTVTWTQALPTESGDYLFSSPMTKGVAVLTIAKKKQGVLVCRNAQNRPLAECSELFADGMWSSSKIEVPQ